MTKSRTWSRAITTITSPRRMSSEDKRYARRSALGAAVASVEVIGLLATVEWIELSGDPRIKQVLASAAVRPPRSLHGNYRRSTMGAGAQILSVLSAAAEHARTRSNDGIGREG